MRQAWFVIAGALLVIAATLLLKSQEERPGRHERAPGPAEVAMQAQPQAEPVPEQSHDATPLRGSDDPVARHRERQAFHDEARAFFAAAPALGADERAQRASELSRQVQQYEARGELSAGEALLLKVALIRASPAADAEQREQIQALQERYREEAAAQEAQRLARHDPMFELYKLREQAIVADVMNMREIPGGLSRDEYLRRQLQSERELLLETATP